MSKQTIVDVASWTVTYYGEADLGRATSDRFWSIRKATIASGVTTTAYAVGNEGQPTSKEMFSWDERASLNYSLIPDVTAPTLSTVTIASNNSDTTKAKVWDIVTLTIISSEYVQNVTATINGNAAIVTEGVDDLHFTAAYTMVSGDTAGLVTFTIDFEDIAGRDGTQVTAVTGGSGVTFDKTAPTATLEYSVDAGSSYASTKKVKDADTLRIKATFSEALLDSPIVKLAINNAILSATNMTKTSTTVYYYDLNVPAGDIATATCSLSIGTDTSGNVVTAAPTNATFTVDNTAPTMSSGARTNNTTLVVTLSELGATASITKANDGWFTVEDAVTGAITYAVSAINPGATDNLVVLTVANVGVSQAIGLKVKYLAAGNGTVTDVAGNALATNATGVTIAAW